MKKCPVCHHDNYDDASRCTNCGFEFVSFNSNIPPQRPYPSDNPFDSCGPEGKSRGIAALFAILLGGLGVQYFYIGKISGGFITILLTIVTCGLWEVVMLVQGILMFCMTNETFRQKYVLSPSTLPLF